MQEGEDVPFNQKWCLWYHYDTQSWTAVSFRKLTTISTVREMWAMVDSILQNNSLIMEHLYIMREGVAPIWEDTRNRNGGCWSIKVDLRESVTMFVKILAFVLGETSMISPDGKNLSTHVMGVSFCSKNTFNAIIQIWNDDKQLSKITLLQPRLAEPYMAEVIYRPHIPEY